MNIAIETRVLGENTGIGTYVRELLKELAAQLPANSIQQLPNLPHPALLPLWLNITLPGSLYAMKPDVVHYTKSDMPNRKVVPTVVTIYDIIPLLLPESQSPLRRWYWPRALRRAALESDHIMTISEASKRGIMGRFDVPSEKITVTPLAVDTNHFSPSYTSSKRNRSISPAKNRRTGLTSPPRQGGDHAGSAPTRFLMKAAGPDAPPYILFVGRWDLRKNIPALIHAFARIAKDIPHQLVIAGRPAPKTMNLTAIAARVGVADRVVFKRDAAYSDMPSLYSGADLFVYPSAIEGWGFPPQEAMACGTPVIVSNGDPLPEVVGDAGEVVPFATSDLRRRLDDDQFVDELAATMRRVLEDETLRSQMIERGLARVQQFSWQSVAEKTLDVYKSLV